MSQSGTVVYTAKTETTGGRDRGFSRSSDGRLDIRLSAPAAARIGTNPEQLFAAGWSASFESAIECAARERNVILLDEVSVAAEVTLIFRDGGYVIGAYLSVQLPGVESNVGSDLIREAENICPYSKATRGNIEVIIKPV